MDKYGETFQARSKYFREQLGERAEKESIPPLYKEYPHSSQIPLPTPNFGTTPSFEKILTDRQSVRNFSPQPLTVQQISTLLWASTGISRVTRGYEFRTAPSAGALYPIETYVVVNRVEGLEAGIYHYNILHHRLELLKSGNYGNATGSGALDQEMCARAAVTWIWTAIFARSRWKYRQRAYRYYYLDAGHIAQNLALASVALGLGSCQIAAFFDDELNQLLEIDGISESTIYLSVVGRI
jgi:SagB-type dehydrogenase family enzyme